MSSTKMCDELTTELLNRGSAPISDRPPGSRSVLQSPETTLWEKFIWLLKAPLRTLMCLSLVTVFFLTYFGFMIPVMWARTIWPRLYWFVEGKLYRWLQSFIATWGYTAGYDVYEYGDDVTTYYRDERVLLMCNHQSTADVPTLMAVLQSKGVASRKTLWLMDVMFRWTPFGMIGNQHGDYFIQQGKATRDKELLRLKKHLHEVFWDRDRRWVILFPEGGFYYKRAESSQKYGKEHGFPHLIYTTLPRQGAVKAILEEVGPRGDDDDAPRERSQSKLKLLKDTVGAIREKKYVKAMSDEVHHDSILSRKTTNRSIGLYPETAEIWQICPHPALRVLPMKFATVAARRVNRPLREFNEFWIKHHELLPDSHG